MSNLSCAVNNDGISKGIAFDTFVSNLENEVESLGGYIEYSSVGGSSYQITINAPAGADPQAIARAVSAELDRREGRQRRAVLSQMADIDG